MADTLITVGTYLTLFLTLPILTAIAIVYWNNKKKELMHFVLS